MKRQRRITALNAVVATTTSSKLWVGGARRIGLQFRAAAITSGNGAFTVKGSLDPYDIATGATNDAFGNKTGGATVAVAALNMVVSNVTNTNAQNRTRVTSTTLSANGDAMAWLEFDVLVNWLEITVTRTTDGTYSAFIVIEEDADAQAGN
jgi:hypothetical protein